MLVGLSSRCIICQTDTEEHLSAVSRGLDAFCTQCDIIGRVDLSDYVKLNSGKQFMYHQSCRKDIYFKARKAEKQTEGDAEKKQRLTRSMAGGFSFRDGCFFMYWAGCWMQRYAQSIVWWGVWQKIAASDSWLGPWWLLRWRGVWTVLCSTCSLLMPCIMETVMFGLMQSCLTFLAKKKRGRPPDTWRACNSKACDICWWHSIDNNGCY